MGISSPTPAIHFCRSSPLSPGSCRSSTRQHGAWVPGRARNSCAEAKTSTCKPADRIRLLSPSRAERSSSTTAMTASDSRDFGICSFFVVLRKRKVEDCASAVIGRSPYPASMRLKDGTANGKSHAHAAGLRRVERVEDPVYGLGVDTCPRVLNRYLHLAGVDVPRADRQFSCPLIDHAHRFDSIHSEIQHNLLQLNPIA